MYDWGSTSVFFLGPPMGFILKFFTWLVLINRSFLFLLWSCFISRFVLLDKIKVEVTDICLFIFLLIYHRWKRNENGKATRTPTRYFSPPYCTGFIISYRILFIIEIAIITFLYIKSPFYGIYFPISSWIHYKFCSENFTKDLTE